MKRFLSGILIALVTFFIGYYAAAYWTLSHIPDFQPGKRAERMPGSWPAGIPGQWKYIAADAAFGFYVPANMQESSMPGIDPYAGRCQNHEINLSFRYAYSSGLEYLELLKGSEISEYEEAWVNIDGKAAKIVTYRDPSGNESRSRFRLSSEILPPTYVAGVYFPEADIASEKLTMTATCKSPADLDTAKTIFKSIRF